MISGVGEIVTDIEKRTTMLPGQSIGEAIPRIRSDGVLLVRVEEVPPPRYSRPRLPYSTLMPRSRMNFGQRSRSL
jgi:hypothetical protein